MNVPAASQLRIGQFDVDLMRRTVRSREDGRSGKLTVKAQQVLLALVDARGDVVSRDALFARVWPDTMPTDDVLTQAVAQLRRTFGDDRDAARYVETIAKGGYRLVADFEWLSEHAAEGGDGPGADASGASRDREPPEATARARTPWALMMLGALALALVAVLAIVWTLNGRREPGGVTAVNTTLPAMSVTYKGITSAPGQERWPMLSPDGKTVAFAHMGEGDVQGGVMLQETGLASARPLTTPPPGSSDQVPVWSPDGRKIAFVRTSPSDCRIMVVAATGGEARAAAECHGGAFSLFDWTPDGRNLLMGGFFDATGASSPLRLLDVSTGEWRPLTYDIGTGDVDSFPRYSPDGKWLGFRRNLSFSDIWVMPAEGGTPKRMTDVHGDIRGWDWLPDGSGVVFSWVGPQISLFRYTFADGALTRLPSLPTGRPVFPDIAAYSWTMVFEIDQLRSGIFRVPTEWPASSLPAREQVFESSGTDLLPSISPDGSTLAFISDRAIALQLWIGEIEHPHTLRAVDGITPIPRHAPVWSADGRKLLVVGTTADGNRLFEVEVGSDRVRQLPVPSAAPFHASYHGREDRMLVGVDAGEGHLRLVLYALPDWQVVGSIDDVAVVRYDDARDQVYFTRPGRAGLWRADAQLRDVVQVTEALPHPAHYRQWVILGGVAFYTGPTAHCRVSWQRMTGDAGSCLVGELSASTGLPTVPQGGRWLYFGLPVAQNIDVGWTDLAKREPTADTRPAGRH